MENLKDIELFIKASSGDKNALSDLYLKYYDILKHYGIRINRNTYFVEESIQELFLSIAVSQYQFGNIQNVKAYLFSSLRRKLLKTIEIERKRLNGLTLSNNITDISFNQADFESFPQRTSEPTIQLSFKLNALPWRQREAIYLRYYNKLSTKEIAEVMGIADQTVLNMLYQALKKLKAHYKV